MVHMGVSPGSCSAGQTTPLPLPSPLSRHTLSDWARHSQQNNFPSHWQVELQPALGHRKIKATQLAADFHVLHVVKARKVPRYG